jgi:hypothetical protein
MRFTAQLDTSHHGPLPLFKDACNIQVGFCGLGERAIWVPDVEECVLNHVDRDPGVSTRQRGEELNVSHMTI